METVMREALTSVAVAAAVDADSAVDRLRMRTCCSSLRVRLSVCVLPSLLSSNQFCFVVLWAQNLSCCDADVRSRSQRHRQRLSSTPSGGFGWLRLACGSFVCALLSRRAQHAPRRRRGLWLLFGIAFFVFFVIVISALPSPACLPVPACLRVCFLLWVCVRVWVRPSCVELKLLASNWLGQYACSFFLKCVK